MVTRDSVKKEQYTKNKRNAATFFSHFVLQLQKKKKTPHNKIYKEEAKL